jgi:hypothetical protein
MGPLSATSRAWKRLGDFYGVRVTICPSLAEARAALQEQLANASPSATDARTNGADNGADNQCTSVHILTVDLDLGVTEQEVAAQLYTLAPMRVLYLTSSKKGKAQLSSDSDQLTSSTPVIVPTSPANVSVVRQPSHAVASSAAPFTGASVKHQRHYPCVRRCLMKPVKTRTLMRCGVELALEPLASIAASPCDDRGSELSWSPRYHEDNGSTGSRSSSRRASVSSTSSSGVWSPSTNPGTPLSGAQQPAVSHRPAIVNVAHRIPLRSVGG